MNALLILLCIVVVTTLVHEGGHALAARAVGWRIDGVVVRWYGIGLKVEGDGAAPVSAVAKIAAGGIIATALLAGACFVLSSVSVYFWVAFVLNAVLLVVNLIPVPASDGRHLLRAIPASGKDKP